MPSEIAPGFVGAFALFRPAIHDSANVAARAAYSGGERNDAGTRKAAFVCGRARHAGCSVAASRSVRRGCAPDAHRHFKTAIYIAVGDVKQLANRATFDRELARASSQLKFDKVWIETYRDRRFATDDEVERVERWFREKGIETSGGMTLAAGGEGGQFGTFDYEKPEGSRGMRSAPSELAARHFDEVILDDFFFYTSQERRGHCCERQHAAGRQYRLDTMRAASREHWSSSRRAQVNPRVKMIIKYPNWYEHFHGPRGTTSPSSRRCSTPSTPAPRRAIRSSRINCCSNMKAIGIFRYFDRTSGPTAAIGGGWVDTFSVRKRRPLCRATLGHAVRQGARRSPYSTGTR